MTEDLTALNRGHCPDCGSRFFHDGPHGGMAANVQCARCGSTFWYSPPFEPKRIDLVDGVYHTERVMLAQINAGWK